jgi:hypothetical protein
MPAFALCVTRSSAVLQRSVSRSMKASLRITFPEVHAATERFVYFTVTKKGATERG